MKKPTSKQIIDWLAITQSIVVILGVIFAAWQVRELALQAQISNATQQNEQRADSATFMMQMDERLDGAQYAPIMNAIENNTEYYPILRTADGGHGGVFSQSSIEDYISNFDEIGSLVRYGVITNQMAYDDFSYDFEKTWCNQDVQHIVNIDRADDDSATATSSPYYTDFEDLSESFLTKDGFTCKEMDSQ